jgi:hypothetical protein
MAATQTPFFRVWNGDSGRFLQDFDVKADAIAYAEGNPDDVGSYEVGFCVPTGNGEVEAVEITEVYI